MTDETVAERRRALLVINPASRRGQDCAAALSQACARVGLQSATVIPANRADVSGVIRHYAPTSDCVIIAGGDGTLNAAAQGLLDVGLPFGIIPAGTANDLARTLDLPLEVDACLDVISRGRTRRIDLGLVNGKPFFNVASIGLSATLAKELTYESKQRLGRLGYALAAVKALLRARPFHATIVSNGNEVAVRTLQVAVGNGRFYGGGMTIEESAHIDDGHLNLYSLEFSAAWKLALMLRSFRHGRHSAWDEVRAIKGKSFTIRTRRPRSINADGEIIGETPAIFQQARKSLSVFVP
jgi:YegS/Rv2252/BmrU family lipid kinase